MTRELPEPELERWQPLRAGIVDLFYYDQEEFWFRDGRLLLRGNNGTGKSKVLALTLPFLLDGDMSPHRVEPDADPKKRMEWNLLLGGDHPHPERLGYTWVEFGRRDGDGTAQYCTIGCGLKAVSGRGIARHWYFVTSRRPGGDLRLVDATGSALTRDRLRTYSTRTGRSRPRAGLSAGGRREAVRLGEQRYGALVDLLVRSGNRNCRSDRTRRPCRRTDGVAAATGPGRGRRRRGGVSQSGGGSRSTVGDDRGARRRGVVPEALPPLRARRLAAQSQAAPEAQSAFERTSRELADGRALWRRPRPGSWRRENDWVLRSRSEPPAGPGLRAAREPGDAGRP